MIVTDTVSAICIVILMLSMTPGNIKVWPIYLLLFIRSSMQAFQGPASQASVDNLVPQSFIPTAAGLNQSVLGLVAIASAPIGAVILGLFPIHQALWIDVITALLSVVSLIFISIPQPSHSSQEKTKMWKEFKEGFNAIYSNLAYRHLFQVVGAVTIFVMPCFTLFTLLVTQHFGGGEQMAGAFGAVSGIGMLLGGVAVAFVNPEKKAKTLLIAWLLSCLAITLTAASNSNVVGLALIAWFISGFTFTYGNAPLTTILQLQVSNHLQGRVFSFLNVLMGLSAPIGLAVVAPLGETIGIQAVMITLSVLAALACFAGFISQPLKSLDKA